jgi:lipid-A-disaccharide synthase
MKKVFVIAGELSGDRTAAWYIHQQNMREGLCYWEGVGGDFMRSAGVILFERFERLNIVGVIEVIRHLPRILKFMRYVVEHIVIEKFDEVVLVDFPGFNLKIAGFLKRRIPGVKITYVAPPQLWCWGAWRAKKIKKLCDTVIVLYPFEVAWYKQRGIETIWLGCPSYNALAQYLPQPLTKSQTVALIPGSRIGEIKRFLPLLIKVARALYKKYPQVHFIIPVATSLPQDFMMQQLNGPGIKAKKLPISLVVGKDDEKYTALRSCCLAITKPGTVTLELALLGVPAIVFFKIAWLTYLLGRCVVRVTYMALPNLLLEQEVYPECIQSRCTVEKIVSQADKVLASFFDDRVFYRLCEAALKPLREMLKKV